MLCVGTELGAETTRQYALSFDGAVIHLDAEPARIGVTYESLGLVGDARATLGALVEELGRRTDVRPGSRRAAAVARVQAVRSRIADGLAAQGRALELGLLSTLEDALSADAIGCFDMTILGYWAAPHLRIADRQQFLYPLGSGTLGYAWPAAIGASIAHPDRPVLAVVGDGGFQYAVAELGTAAQHRVDAKLLIVDDGGYGILREYQREAFGETTAVELPGKDLFAVAAAYGVPVRSATPDDLGEQLAWAFAQPGPAVVVLRVAVDRRRPDAMNPAELLRRSVIGVGPYVPGAGARELKARTGRTDLIRLNWNENLLGPLDGVLDAVAASLPDAVWAYPEEGYEEFRIAVARWAGADPNQVIPGHGIQALTLSLVAALVEPGRPSRDPASDLWPVRVRLRGRGRRCDSRRHRPRHARVRSAGARPHCR